MADVKEIIKKVESSVEDIYVDKIFEYDGIFLVVAPINKHTADECDDCLYLVKGNKVKPFLPFDDIMFFNKAAKNLIYEKKG